MARSSCILLRWTAGALLLALGACASAPEIILPDPALQCRADRGSGGTGINGDDRGIGGTGLIADRGMGGTGIVGTVTGFSSICVNGFRVAYSSATPVTVDGEAANADVLERGLTVAVTATMENGQLQAEKIDVVHTLVGPLTSVPNADGVLTVMNVPVVTANATGSLANLAVGDVVAVDGLQRATGTVDATHVAVMPPDTLAQVRGLVRGNTIGTVIFMGVPYTPNGAWVHATGTWSNGFMHPVRFVEGFEISAAARVSVEGTLSPRADGSFSIRGLTVRADAARGLDAALLARAAAGQRVQILGQRQRDGSIRPETLIVPERLAPLVETTTVTRPAAAAAEVQSQRGVYGTTVVTRPNVVREVAPVVRPNTILRPEVRPQVRPEVPTRPQVPTRR